MAYEYDPSRPLFRALTDQEETVFRLFAIINEPELDKWELYHPVCRAAWIHRGIKPPTREED